MKIWNAGGCDEMTVFTQSMKRLIGDRMEKKGNSWERLDMDYLMGKIEEHAEKARDSFRNCPNEAMDELVHIANYCMFLYVRIGLLQTQIEDFNIEDEARGMYDLQEQQMEEHEAARQMEMAQEEEEKAYYGGEGA